MTFSQIKIAAFVYLFYLVCGEVVKTPLGPLRGKKTYSWTGAEILAFKGIRYVQPPLNNLRFKPPVPVKPWNETVDALEDGPVCPQPSDFFGPTSEDCLFMNVFTKPKQIEKNSKKVPVIVFIHPGGYYSQTSRSDFFGPAYILDHDIVIVTFNYRLGALGFLCTEDVNSVGNNGLKDQVAALRWVRDNIESFGGDPSKVTLAGYSVGSSAVLLHMLSPMSKGLFHRAIAMSGGLTSPWVLKKDQLQLSKRLAKLVDCEKSTNNEIVECLRNVPAKTLADTYTKLREWNLDPVMLYGVVIEPDFGQERFFTEEPINILKNGKANDVPLVIGMTKNEFDTRADFILENETLREELNKDFEKIFPIAFYYERDTAKSREISQTLRKFYFNDSEIKPDSKAMGKMYTDGLMVHGIEQSAKLLSKQLKSPVYFYMSSYKGRYSHSYIKGTQEPAGIAHLDDLIYLFDIPKRFPMLKPTDPEANMVETYTSMWVKFATTGDPTPITFEGKWNKLKSDCHEYLNIDSPLSMTDGLPYKDRMALWDTINPPLE